MPKSISSHTSAVSFLAVVGVTACAVEPAVFAFSDGATVRSALSDKSVVGQLDDGTSYCEYHDPGGLVVGRDFEVYAGNWAMQGDRICYSYPGFEADCQNALVDGPRVRFLDAVSGALVARGNIVEGNVCS